MQTSFILATMFSIVSRKSMATNSTRGSIQALGRGRLEVTIILDLEKCYQKQAIRWN